MVTAATRHGYGGVTVTRVVAYAKVSRSTFYQHFSGLDDCFLAAHRAVSKRLRGALRKAIAPGAEPRAVLQAVTSLLVTEPAALRFFLVEAPAAPAPLRVGHTALLFELESTIDRYLTVSQPRLQIPAAALLGAVGSVLSIRLCNGESESPEILTDELSAWLQYYQADSRQLHRSQQSWDELGQLWLDGPPPSAMLAPTLLPRGRHRLAPSEAASDRRGRILAATARVVAAKGYAGLTVAEIVATARVPRASFYTLFSGKEEAFISAQTLALRQSIAAAAAEYSLGSSWPDRVWRAGGALAHYIASHPEFAVLELLETSAAGPSAVRRQHQNRMAYVLFLGEGYRQWGRAAELPSLCSEAIAGAVYGLLRRQALLGRITEIPACLPQLAYVVLAPFTGSNAALEFVLTKAQEAPPVTPRAL
jgi:AcrR family transcriptional regulator